MAADAPNPELPPATPLRAVVDTNTFPRSTVMTRLTDAAANGALALFWSPYIIAEASRV